MQRKEKNFPASEAASMPPVKPIPRWVSDAAIKKRMDRQLSVMRKSMGGTSRDITTRVIWMQDHLIEGYREQIKLRRYWPAGEPKPRKLHLFLHGGGWFGGSLWAVEEYLKGLADRADAVVLSVEYSLAPEHPFPEGLMDGYEALKWAWERAEQLSADRARFSISGDSAGGNLAAAIAIMARDEGQIKLESQVLIYPVLDLTLPGAASPLGPLMTRPSMVMARWYLGDFDELADPRVSPMQAKSHSRLPRALVAVCEFDGLRRQGEAYAEALSEAGVDATLITYKNTQHGFIDNTGTQDQALDLIREVVRFLDTPPTPDESAEAQRDS